jgi:hypothetical protein
MSEISRNADSDDRGFPLREMNFLEPGLGCPAK